MNYFNLFEKNPIATILTAFPKLRTIAQNDILTENNKIIDMNFLRSIGVPIEQNWVLKNWLIDFNCTFLPLRTPIEILYENKFDLSSSNFDKSILKKLQYCICLGFYCDDIKKESCSLLCLDKNDNGAIVSVDLSSKDISDRLYTKQEFLFVNSSLEQFIQTLALYTVHQERPIREDDDTDTIFVEYVCKIDNKALIPAPDDTFWIRVVDGFLFLE
jgi:uncharacterized protein Smg (DUF494 family)